MPMWVKGAVIGVDIGPDSAGFESDVCSASPAAAAASSTDRLGLSDAFGQHPSRLQVDHFRSNEHFVAVFTYMWC